MISSQESTSWPKTSESIKNPSGRSNEGIGKEREPGGLEQPLRPGLRTAIEYDSSEKVSQQAF